VKTNDQQKMTVAFLARSSYSRKLLHFLKKNLRVDRLFLQRNTVNQDANRMHQIVAKRRRRKMMMTMSWISLMTLCQTHQNRHKQHKEQKLQHQRYEKKNKKKERREKKKEKERERERQKEREKERKKEREKEEQKEIKKEKERYLSFQSKQKPIVSSTSSTSNVATKKSTEAPKVQQEL
jgi:hypothetical protein